MANSNSVKARALAYEAAILARQKPTEQTQRKLPQKLPQTRGHMYDICNRILSRPPLAAVKLPRTLRRIVRQKRLRALKYNIDNICARIISRQPLAAAKMPRKLRRIVKRNRLKQEITRICELIESRKIVGAVRLPRKLLQLVRRNKRKSEFAEINYATTLMPFNATEAPTNTIRRIPSRFAAVFRSCKKFIFSKCVCCQK